MMVVITNIARWLVSALIAGAMGAKLPWHSWDLVVLSATAVILMTIAIKMCLELFQWGE